MFESIIYKNATGPGPLIDIGALAEGLIFYGRVVIVGNTGTLKDILSRIPPFIFLSLLRDGRIEFHYLADQTGVSTIPTIEGRSRHDLICFSSPDHTIEKVSMQAFKDAAGNTGSARVGASKFARLLKRKIGDRPRFSVTGSFGALQNRGLSPDLLVELNGSGSN